MRTTTRAAAGALAVTLTFGLGAPIADAAGHGRTDHVKGNHGQKGSKGSQEARQLLRDIARADARLAQTLRASRTSKLGDHAAAVLANVTADRATLADLTLAVQSPDSDLEVRSVRKELKDLRVQNYEQVVNALRQAVRLAADLDEARTVLAGDATAPVADLDAAEAALDAAIAKAYLVTAASDRGELRAVETDLRAARGAFTVVRDHLEGTTEDETTEDEPVVEEPAEEEPAEEEPAEELVESA